MVIAAEVPQLIEEVNSVRGVLAELADRLALATPAEALSILRAAIDAEGRAAALTGRYINLRPLAEGEERLVGPGFDEVFVPAWALRDRAMTLIAKCHEILRLRMIEGEAR
ncbi:MAG: hypothetical protein U0326_19965 [Polyangiales bacterium]